MPTSTARITCLLASLLLLAAGCTKEKLENCPGQCTVVAGRLLTSGQQPLANAPVSMYWRSTKGSFGTGSRLKAQATTDANGSYQLRFYVADDEFKDGYFETVFTPDKTRYFLIGSEHDAFFTLKRDTTYQQPPYLIPRKATINLKVPNANQIQGYMMIESVSAHARNLNVGPTKSGSGTVLFVYNQPTALLTTVDVAADQSLFIRVSKTANGHSVRTIDSLVVAAGATRDITITY